jgi:hypothetical protein
MSVSDRDSGIVTAHIASLEKACRALNTFLFIRPTEYDTTMLIDQGYATKSMSVHDKSSNWGPMAGFVPCDQFFSKKFIGAGPNRNAATAYKDHGPAKVAHLRLTDALVNNHTKMKQLPGRASATSRVYTSPQAGNEAAKRIEFELVKAGDGWDVYWLDKSNGSKRIPVFCWGYVIDGTATPVTGDYDLWMVAPHMSWWKLHMHTVGVKDEHGSSCATLLNTWLLNKLNEACGRAGNPVFNHGAEAQNYGFTQALDSRLVMITPAGGSRMIDRGEMPEVLVDLQSAGYLIYWNKRYGETDPRLGGQQSPVPILSELSSELAKISGPGGQGSGLLKHLLKKDERLRDVLDIRLFYNRLRGLDSELKARGKPQVLRVGEGEDLPADYAEKAGSDKTLAAQRALQQAVIGSTVGSGEADMARLEAWVENNIEHVFTLCEAYGEVPGAAGGGREGGFLLEAIPGTGQYKRA